MAVYKAKVPIWHSDQCRTVQPGEEFDAEFPIGYQSDSIETVHDQRVEALEKAKAYAAQKAEAEAEVKTPKITAEKADKAADGLPPEPLPDLLALDDKKLGAKYR